MNRTGKIARLPDVIRNELNHRLADGESGITLLPWLNELPAVKECLAEQFGGDPINKQNLSAWRTGGFAEWEARREMLAQARELASDPKKPADFSTGTIAEALSTLLAARYGSFIRGWNGEENQPLVRKLRVLHGMTRDVTRLRRVDHDIQRLQLRSRRLDVQREKENARLLARELKRARSDAEASVQPGQSRSNLCKSIASPAPSNQPAEPVVDQAPVTAAPSAPVAPSQGQSSLADGKRSTCAPCAEASGTLRRVETISPKCSKQDPAGMTPSKGGVERPTWPFSAPTCRRAFQASPPTTGCAPSFRELPGQWPNRTAKVGRSTRTMVWARPNRGGLDASALPLKRKDFMQQQPKIADNPLKMAEISG